jgi:hypothetical protein
MTDNAASTGTSPEQFREEAVHAMSTLAQVVAAARDDLRDYESVITHARDDLAAGSPVAEMVERHRAGDVRASFSDRLSEIERVRAAARLALWQLQLSEGSTIADIARAWGYSRQLVSRTLADPGRVQPEPKDPTEPT